MDNVRMEYINQLLNNDILITAIICWLVAQVAKTIINAYLTQSLDLSRLLGDGGMPSAHTATVTGMALMTGLQLGFDSPLFAVAAVLDVVVMHDATGVRYETQQQTNAIEQIVSYFNELTEENISLEVKLKKFVGHSKMQVFVGFCVGILVTLVIYFCF